MPRFTKPGQHKRASAKRSNPAGLFLVGGRAMPASATPAYQAFVEAEANRIAATARASR